MLYEKTVKKDFARCAAEMCDGGDINRLAITLCKLRIALNAANHSGNRIGQVPAEEREQIHLRGLLHFFSTTCSINGESSVESSSGGMQ
jgi:hypothetical protein